MIGHLIEAWELGRNDYRGALGFLNMFGDSERRWAYRSGFEHEERYVLTGKRSLRLPFERLELPL